VPSRRGQALLVAVAVLAVALNLAILALRVPEPRVKVGSCELWAAELVHASRLCFSTGGCSRPDLQSLLAMLAARAAEIGMDSYPTTVVDVRAVVRKKVPEGRGWGYRAAVLEFMASAGAIRVVFNASWSCTLIGRYTKTVKGRLIEYLRFRLHYEHFYAATLEGQPALWGNVTLYPALWDPERLADLEYLGSGDWVVGVPTERPAGVPPPGRRYELEDEYGVRVEIRW